MNQTENRQLSRHKQGLTEKELHALIAEVEASGMLRPPVDFKQNVMEKTKRADVQLIVQTQKMNKGLQLFFYSLKIGMAAAMALFFLFWVPQDFSLPQMGPSIETRREMEPKETMAEKWDRGTEEMAEQLKNFAEQLLNKGGE